MGGIVDDLEAVLVGNLLDNVGIDGLAVAVDGHDSGGLRGDGGLYLIWVETAGALLDIDEDGLDAVPPEGMGGGDEAIGGGDDLAGDAQGLQGCDQGKGAVGEQAELGYLEVVSEGSLQLLVEGAVVGDPLLVPYLLEEFVELVEVGEEG